jgi:NAD-dependent DNA ligase
VRLAPYRAHNEEELCFLKAWLDDNERYAERHPFNELYPIVERAVADGVITDEEWSDISWLCNRLLSTEYFDATTADMQKLHAILAGIGSDGQIQVGELMGLSTWLSDHQHLKRCWPYDEVEGLVYQVLADKRIDPDEHKFLMTFFDGFVSIFDNKTIINPVLIKEGNIVGVCSICPEISFADSVFCLTGESHKYTRAQFEEQIVWRGGTTVKGVSKKVNYLIVGADGNPCWAYACYGRKVEKAVELRKAGHPLMIVHENDFHDAVAD